jgi:hypothetical protein
MNLSHFVIIRLYLKSSFPKKSIFGVDDLASNFRLSHFVEQTSNLPWVRLSSFEEVESRGIVAGVEENGNKVYVGRTYDKDGNFVIAKIVPAIEKSFYAFNGAEESGIELEILDNTANCHWVKSDGKVVEDAATVNGFYIGRALYNGNIVVGRVDVGKRELIGTYDGSTFNLPSYDVLIYKATGK